MNKPNLKSNFVNSIQMKRLFGMLLLLVLLTIIPIVSAAIDTNDMSDVFKVNSHIAYTKPCINNGTWCSASAKCNYTFYNLNNDIINNNVEALNIGLGGASLWQYNFTRSEVGIYKVDMVCCDTSLCGSETLYYETTGSGRNDSVWFDIIILFISFGIIIFGFYLQDGWVVVMGSFGLYFVGIEILRFGIAGMKNLTSTWAIGIIVLCLAAYFSINSAKEMIESNM